MAELGSQEISVWMATAAVECRVGEARAALDAADVAAGLPGLAPRHRWRPMLLRAVAAHRLGREDAADLAAAAVEEAAATGVAALPAILEPDLTAILLPLAAVRSATAAAVLGAGTAIEVDVLGGFTVTVGGSAVDLPAGRPTHLLKLLAVRGGQESVDVVIDELWPDAAPDRGRPLLRNVLHRLRRDTGHELVVRAGERLSLLPGTVVDLARFEDLSGRARHGGTDAVAAARAAVGAYRGPLLPDDLYEPWTALPREHARRELLAALDVLAADAEARADVDAAVDVLEQAIAEDPDGDHRYLRAARLLAAAGRPGLALAMLDRAAAALAQLGLAPHAEHQALRRTL
jgi:DNA-binding SARP family transcriptional activator